MASPELQLTSDNGLTRENEIGVDGTDKSGMSQRAEDNQTATSESAKAGYQDNQTTTSESAEAGNCHTASVVLVENPVSGSTQEDNNVSDGTADHAEIHVDGIGERRPDNDGATDYSKNANPELHHVSAVQSMSRYRSTQGEQEVAAATRQGDRERWVPRQRSEDLPRHHGHHVTEGVQARETGRASGQGRKSTSGQSGTPGSSTVMHGRGSAGTWPRDVKHKRPSVGSRLLSALTGRLSSCRKSPSPKPPPSPCLSTNGQVSGVHSNS